MQQVDVNQVSTATGTPAPAGTVEVPETYFTVSTSKMVLLSLCSGLFYLFYWMYCQWDLIRSRNDNQSEISPFWRSFFSIFFVHKLFSKIRTTTSAAGVSGNTSDDTLAWMYIVLALIGNGVGRVQAVFHLVSFLIIVPCVMMQEEINAYTRKTNSYADMNENYSGLNILVIVVGGLFWTMAMLGLIARLA